MNLNNKYSDARPKSIVKKTFFPELKPLFRYSFSKNTNSNEKNHVCIYCKIDVP